VGVPLMPIYADWIIDSVLLVSLVWWLVRSV
jgi:hypothetical protein